MIKLLSHIFLKLICILYFIKNYFNFSFKSSQLQMLYNPLNLLKLFLASSNLIFNYSNFFNYSSSFTKPNLFIIYHRIFRNRALMNILKLNSISTNKVNTVYFKDHISFFKLISNISIRLHFIKSVRHNSDQQIK